MVGMARYIALPAFFLVCVVPFIMVACGGGGGSAPAGAVPAGTPTVTAAPAPSPAPGPVPIHWKPPGGNATLQLQPDSNFLQFAPSIPASRLGGVSQGRELFIADWLPAPHRRTVIDGLGPLFNAASCVDCHSSTGRVPPLNTDGTTTPAILFRLGKASGQVHPTYGAQLQDKATTGKPEGTVRWQASTGNPSTLEYILTLYDKPDLGTFRLGPRIAPQLIGMGLLDLVDTEQILEYSDPNDADGDGISGRPHWITDEGTGRQLGKFGWKAINSTLKTQNAGALHQDMGLTSSIHPQENCTSAQTICSTEPNGGTPEVSETSLNAISSFMTALAVPDRRISNQESFDAGARLFDRISCAQCHRPSFTTGNSAQFPSLSGQTIYAYTDLLLHDMGEKLADGVREKNASGSEWRTPPLWGIGLVAQDTNARFLHDGRAASIDEAIRLHGGEGKAAATAYIMLTDSERAQLLQFLNGI